MIRGAYALLVGLLCMPTLAVSQESPVFETGVLCQGKPGVHYCYPVIARTGAQNLFAVWSLDTRQATEPKHSVVIQGALSKDGGKTWESPRTLISTPGMGDYDPNIVVDGHRILVFSTTTKIELPLIDHSEVWMTSSDDEGKRWTKPSLLPLPFRYFVGKRHLGITLKDGSLAMPFSWDIWAQVGRPARTEGEMDLKSGILVSADHGATWTPRGELHILEPKTRPDATGGVCEPALVELDSGELYLLMRTGTSHLYEARSRDRGRTWTRPAPSALTGCNTPMALWRLDQNPKEIIVVWDNSPVERYPLCTAISSDGGRTWSSPKEVTGGAGSEVSYPGVTQASDGMFVVVWQQQLPSGGRDIRWARFNRAWALAR